MVFVRNNGLVRATYGLGGVLRTTHTSYLILNDVGVLCGVAEQHVVLLRVCGSWVYAEG